MSLELEPGTMADWFSGTMSALAVMVAVGSYSFSEWRHRRENKQRDIVTIRQIGVKLLKVFNSSHGIHQHLWQDTKPVAEGQSELWRRTFPLVGLQHEPGLSLDSAEINLLIEMKQHNYLMEMMLMTERYQSIISSMMDYRVRYEAVYAMMPPPRAMEGHVGRHALTEEQYLRLQPYSIQLERLLQSLRAMTQENVEMGERLTEQFTPMTTEYFGKPVFKIGKPDTPKDGAVASRQGG